MPDSVLVACLHNVAHSSGGGEMLLWKAFVGVIINMGMLKLIDIKEYWSTHTTTNLPFFRRVFSRDRFFTNLLDVACWRSVIHN